MIRRYQVHVHADVGPAVMVIHADAVVPEGELLWFRNENRIVGCAPMNRVRMILLDRVDLRVGRKARIFREEPLTPVA